MSGVTVDGVPWEEYRPWETGPTNLEFNERALAPASREVGYCLCMHPFSNVISFEGLSCKWCEQQTTEASSSPEARTLRTAAILGAFPELAK